MPVHPMDLGHGQADSIIINVGLNLNKGLLNLKPVSALRLMKQIIKPTLLVGDIFLGAIYMFHKPCIVYKK